MATKQELETKIQDLKDSLDAVPDEFKADIQAEIDSAQAELDAMGMTPPESPAMPPAAASDDDFIKAMLSTIATTMASGEGSGVDSPTVRAMIKEYLKDEKVKLDELDKSIHMRSQLPDIIAKIKTKARSIQDGGGSNLSNRAKSGK